MSAPYLLALDIGGTKLAAGLFTRAGELLLRRQEQTAQRGPAYGIAQMAQLVAAVLDEGAVKREEVLGLGVGIPAVLAPESDHVIWAPNLQGWRDVDLRTGLAKRLELPVYIEYDGHTAVLGEWWLGAGRGYASAAMIIVGTGIGGGLVLDGRLYRGHNRLAGAAGWFALTGDPDLMDPRGQEIGHWESLAAGPGITRRAIAAALRSPASALYAPAQTGMLTAKDVFDAARAGDSVAQGLVDETARLLGLGVSNIVSLVNPQIVVLGGSIGCQTDLLLDPLRRVVARWAQPASAAAVRITGSLLGSDAGLYGAAYTALLRSAAP